MQSDFTPSILLPGSKEPSRNNLHILLVYFPDVCVRKPCRSPLRLRLSSLPSEKYPTQSVHFISWQLLSDLITEPGVFSAQKSRKKSLEKRINSVPPASPGLRGRSGGHPWAIHICIHKRKMSGLMFCTMYPYQTLWKIPSCLLLAHTVILERPDYDSYVRNTCRISPGILLFSFLTQIILSDLKKLCYNRRQKIWRM